MSTTPGSEANCDPAHPAVSAPTRSWPWAPMLNSPVRNAIATEIPVRISGIAETIVSVTSYGVPKAPWRRAAYAATGSLPLSRTKIAPKARAMTTDRIGTAGPTAHWKRG